MTPEELFPDGQDSMRTENVSVRKGTIGAFIQNCKLLEANPEPQQRARIEADLVALLPAMHALRVFDVFDVRSDEIKTLVTSCGSVA